MISRRKRDGTYKPGVIRNKGMRTVYEPGFSS
jgi:hypothetical protein